MEADQRVAASHFLSLFGEVGHTLHHTPHSLQHTANVHVFGWSVRIHPRQLSLCVHIQWMSLVPIR